MQVEAKYYINSKEVILIAEAYSTKIYQDTTDTNQFYITSCDDIVATMHIMDTTIVIEEKYQKYKLL